MQSIDLEKMSLDELKKLEKDVSRAIKTFEKRRLDEARAAAEAVAKEMGFSLGDLAVEAKTSKSPPKYRDPKNPELTWSGRGRKPFWFVEAIDAGHSPEELEI